MCFLKHSFIMATRTHRPQGQKLVFFIRITTQTTYFKIITTPYFIRQRTFFSHTDWTIISQYKLRPVRDWEILNFIKLTQHYKMH
jgi:hypothetical protein